MRKFVSLFVLVYAGWVGSVNAATVPAGLSPGDTYQLLFVTQDVTTALSSNVAYYNGFAQSEADASRALTENMGLTWDAMISTETIDANSNALVSGPVYRVDGTKIADDYNSIWDGDISVPVSLNQYGVFTNTSVWTGSESTGSARHDFEAGITGSFAIAGTSIATGANWIAGAGYYKGEHHSLYALSNVITVSAVPLPAAAWLFISAIAGLAGAKRMPRSKRTA